MNEKDDWSHELPLMLSYRIDSRCPEIGTLITNYTCIPHIFYRYSACRCSALIYELLFLSCIT